MNWYNSFNAVEAVLWGLVAIVIPFRVTCTNPRQRATVVLGSFAFVAFGVTDILEISHEAAIPLWLWGCKVACGVAILIARYTWLGWNRFRWRDREILFGLGCLAGVVVVFFLQRILNPLAIR